MQKKDYTSSSSPSSSWQETLNKEKRNSFLQKLIIWGGIALVSIAGIAFLVKLAGTNSPQTSVETANLPKVSEKDIIVGDKNAKITITEYSDFQCPACASYNPIVDQLLSDYKGKLNLVYRFFPLTGIHKNAIISGRAGYAGWKLGKFDEMKDELFNNQKDWELLSEDKARETFIDYAKSIKIDSDEFTKIMNSDEAKNAVLAGEKEALGLGLNSTPTFFVGNKKVSPSGYDEFKQIIDTQLNQQKPLQ